MSLTPKQIEIIKATVPVLQEYGDIIASTFYKNLLDAAPALNNIFNKTNQVNNEQPRALAGALYAYAANIDNLEVLSSAIERISQKHVSLFVKADLYPTVGKFLLEAMGEILGSDVVTSDVLDAWTAAYNQLASVLIAAEDKMYKADGGWKDWRDFEIKKKVEESDEITSFYLYPVDGVKLPGFKPGQYISLRTEVPDLKYLQARQYSLSDAPREDYYRISVKRDEGIEEAKEDPEMHPGYISNVLHKTKNEGDIVQLSHPHGEFFLDADTLNEGSALVLISAGVGLTPMLSMLNTLTAQKSTVPVSWIHAVRRTKAQAFAPYVRSVCSSYPNIQSKVFVKSPAKGDVEGEHYHHTGRMALDKLDQEKDLFLENKKSRYYICGPTEFMVDMQKKLQTYGVDADRIKLELFGTGGAPSS